jgi:DNA-binding CsgD family transcriptional regulator
MKTITNLGEGLLLIGVEAEACTPSPLTAAEHAVVKLAAQGLSNEAIAELRSCSVRTVANQLAASYRKFAVSGRRELKAMLVG